MQRQLAVMAIVTGVVLGRWSDRAEACSCMGMTEEQALARADVAFEGAVQASHYAPSTCTPMEPPPPAPGCVTVLVHNRRDCTLVPSSKAVVRDYLGLDLDMIDDGSGVLRVCKLAPGSYKIVVDWWDDVVPFELGDAGVSVRHDVDVGGPWQLRFTVDEALKGVKPGDDVLINTQDDASVLCGVGKIPVGTWMRVYANGHGHLHTTYCSGTHEIEAREPRVPQFFEPADETEAAPPVAPPRRSRGCASCAASSDRESLAAAGLFVALVGWRLRRSPRARVHARRRQ